MKYIRTIIEEIDCEENTCGNCEDKILEEDCCYCDYWVKHPIDTTLHLDEDTGDYKRLEVCKTVFKKSIDDPLVKIWDNPREDEAWKHLNRDKREPSFNKEDVYIVAKEILENAIRYMEGDYDEGHYCEYYDEGHYCECCGSKYYEDEKDIEHDANCPYLVAKDLLTGIEP